MKSRSSRIRGDARSYADRAGPTAEESANGGEGAESEPAGNDDVRGHILDATVACFIEHGWGGTNMSVIARRAQVTRGRIQYYFPTLDELLRAAIDYLNEEWRRKYFPILEGIADAPERFDAGVDVLWRLMQHPLHVAKQELEASARTNQELAALMQQAAAADDEMNLSATRKAYPALAEKGDEAIRLARDFTLVFMEGLSLYRFSHDADARRTEQLALLKSLLLAFWNAHGVEVGGGEGPAPPSLTLPPPAQIEPDPDRQRALRLILEAAALLAGSNATAGAARSKP